MAKCQLCHCDRQHVNKEVTIFGASFANDNIDLGNSRLCLTDCKMRNSKLRERTFRDNSVSHYSMSPF